MPHFAISFPTSLCDNEGLSIRIGMSIRGLGTPGVAVLPHDAVPWCFRGVWQGVRMAMQAEDYTNEDISGYNMAELLYATRVSSGALFDS